MKTVLSAAFVLLGIAAPAQNTILAMAWDGTALHVDATTGASTPLGASGANFVNSLAASPTTGLFYTIAAVGPGILYTVNPFTGAATNSGVTVNATSLAALAIASSGVGYAIVSSSLPGLYSVDLTTGVATLISNNNTSGIQGLAFNAAGVLYGWRVDPFGAFGTLVTVNPTNGTVTTIGSGAGNIQSIAFSPSGVLYGARSQLYGIDTATGTTTPIGGGGYGDIRGIEFAPPSPPPPPTLAFLPANGVVAPGGILAVLYDAPGHGGESFAPIASCTLGSLGAPFLPHPLGIAWDVCTDFYFNNPLSQTVLPLTGSPGSFTGTLDTAGKAIGFVLPPASFPPALNQPIYVTYVTWTASNVYTVGTLATALLY